jgi:predicted DNA binding CopG/RHH family protein
VDSIPFKIVEQIFNIFWICNTFDIFIKYGNKNKKIILRITESQLAKIVAETKRQKMNKSSLVRTVLDEYFAQKLSEEIMDKYRVKKHIN